MSAPASSFDCDALLQRLFPPVAQEWSERESMLYALGCGLGDEPLDRAQLRFLYERSAGGLQALPTMANVIGYPGFWADQPDTGIDWRRLVHAEQAIVLHQPLPAAGRFIGRNRVTGLHDKGAAKGAILLQERSVSDAASGELLATVTQTTMLRGNGGFAAQTGQASVGAPLPAPHVMPRREPDAIGEFRTLPQSALLYRLSGDFNPLHADPAVAEAAGFPRPILHGMATMGMAMHAVLRTLLDYDVKRVAGMRVRFTAPLLPGETLRTEMWQSNDVISLRAYAMERNTVVLDAGRVDLNV